MKFRKCPIEIEACQFMGTLESAKNIVDTFGSADFFKLGVRSDKVIRVMLDHINPDYLEIVTLNGTMIAEIGDWIIKGINGEFYLCKPDIFEKVG